MEKNSFGCERILADANGVKGVKPTASCVKRFVKIITSYLPNFLTFFILFFTLYLLLATCDFAHAGGMVYWTPNGVLMSENSGVAGLVNDKAGGALAFGVYAESIIVNRIDRNGNLPWGLHGRSIASYAGYQGGLVSVDDHCGGAIAVWCKNIPQQLYCQRVDSMGNRMWGSDAQRVTLSDSAQWWPAVASDGAKGMIVAWQERCGEQGMNFNWNIYAQRIDSMGVRRWGDYGVAVCTIDSSQEYPAITLDSSGSSIIVWHDFRNGNSDLFAQRLSISGLPLWQSNGVAVCDTNGAQNNAGSNVKVIVTATDTTVVTTWSDSRIGDYDIYAQNLTLGGIPLWLTQGTIVCDTTDTQGGVQLVPDGRGGVISCWFDRRNGYWNIYSQRLSGSGEKLWLNQGIQICNTDSCLGWDYYRPLKIVTDGNSGAIICWEDKRSGNWDIYAQHVDSLGNIVWNTNGMAVCTAVNNQQNQDMIVSDSGRAIICWTDYRSGSGRGYAQKVGDDLVRTAETSEGETGRQGVEVYPNPFFNRVTIKFQITNPKLQMLNSQPQAMLKIFDATGRVVKDFSCSTPYALHPTHILWNGTDDAGLLVPAGVYFVWFGVKDFYEIKKVIKLE